MGNGIRKGAGQNIPQDVFELTISVPHWHYGIFPMHPAVLIFPTVKLQKCQVTISKVFSCSGTILFAGDPVWTHLASDYTYDELGCGSDLPLPEELLSQEDVGVTDKVGYWGELLVYRYLQAQKAIGNILDVTWSNQDGETKNPYDFEVRFADENHLLQTDFIEVKSTLSDAKEVFPISVQQIKFADEKGDNFHIYRVFNAGNPEKVKLIRIHDLNLRLSQKQVKLCMMI